MLDFPLFLTLFCMVTVAFFAGIETGVISIHRMRLRRFVKMGSRNASILQGYINSPDRLLGTTLVGTNLFTVIASVTAASLAGRLLGKTGEAVSTAVMGFALLVFSEYLPKAWFHSQPIRRCSRFAGALRIGEIVLLPLSRVIMWINNRILPGTQEAFSNPAPFVTKEDLKLLAQEGEKDGVLSPKERSMIHRVIELSGKTARQIMIPRKDIKCVNTDTPLRQFFDKAMGSNLLRMPVADRHSGDFVGIINVFYALPALARANEEPVCLFMRKPLFIPENTPVDELLPLMRKFRQPMCLVRNAEGAVSGLLTTEDVLKEILGNL
jgi:CBS domain containing-hemolysin-like protein